MLINKNKHSLTKPTSSRGRKDSKFKKEKNKVLGELKRLIPSRSPTLKKERTFDVNLEIKEKRHTDSKQT